MKFFTNRRTIALGSLVAVFLGSILFQERATEIAQQQIDRLDSKKVIQYRWAKWHYYLSDLVYRRKVYPGVQKYPEYPESKHTLTRASVKERKWHKSSFKKYGYVNSLQDMVVPAIFDSVPEYFSDERAIVIFKGKPGVIDKQGRLIAPFMFDTIDKSAKQGDRDYILATIDGKVGITDLKGKTIVSFEFDRIYSFNQTQNYVVASKPQERGWAKFGVADLEGNTIIPFEYTAILSHTPDITVVEKLSAIGTVDRQAKFVPLVYSLLTDPIRDDKQPNVYEFIPAFQSDTDDYFINDLALVSYQDGNIERYCVVNRQGKLLVSSKADSFRQKKMDNSLCQIVAGEKPDYDLSEAVAALKDTSSKSSHPAYGFNGDLFQISINGRNAYANLEGELVSWLNRFDQVGNFSEGLAPFVKDNRYGFVTPEGEIAFYLDDDLVAASYSAKSSYHYIRGADFVFYPEQFVGFENGLAKVTHMNIQSLESKWDCPAYDKSPLGYAYIDKTGKTVKYEPIISIESQEYRGSEGNYQHVDCNLRIVN